MAPSVGAAGAGWWAPTESLGEAGALIDRPPRQCLEGEGRARASRETPPASPLSPPPHSPAHPPAQPSLWCTRGASRLTEGVSPGEGGGGEDAWRPARLSPESGCSAKGSLKPPPPQLGITLPPPAATPGRGWRCPALKRRTTLLSAVGGDLYAEGKTPPPSPRRLETPPPHTEAPSPPSPFSAGKRRAGALLRAPLGDSSRGQLCAALCPSPPLRPPSELVGRGGEGRKSPGAALPLLPSPPPPSPSPRQPPSLPPCPSPSLPHFSLRLFPPPGGGGKYIYISRGSRRRGGRVAALLPRPPRQNPPSLPEKSGQSR
ncbi:BEN domain containing 4 BEND4 transcript variant X2 mRNA [Crotalus adamanteus]|uniref:BEN domain containing 4 BEND4 transcript variant X2 mRNA n=1 Tax=Crotalus adamanteus TaxID=8729 RepID=A0AAW1BBW3_CROAD